MISELPKSIKETQDGLVKRTFSAVDLVDLCLLRINKFDHELNSFLTISDDLAYKQAKKVDRIIGQLGRDAFIKHPLLGTVFSYKDLFLTKGVRTTAGSKVLENYVPSYSSTGVERLENAGCITIGKTNCDAWGHGASGENSDFGPTKNPYDKSLVAGGSSSGSSAAVAASFCMAATGTDTGGSIRCPANFCGVVGLKPTYGAVSRFGVIAMASSLDSVGHITKNVSDSRKIFNVIKGADGWDGNVKDEKKVKSKKSDYVVGVPKEYFVDGIDANVKNSIEKVKKVLSDAGVRLVEISLPHTKYAVSVYYIIQPAEVSSNLSRYDGVRYGNDRGSFGDEAKRRIMLGSYVLSAGYYDAYYLKAMKVRSKIISDFNSVFSKVDAILAPTFSTPAFEIGERSKDPLSMYLADVFTAPASLAGIPSIAIPCGYTRNELPLGFQLMGPRFSEGILFDLGELYERKSGIKKILPKLT